MSIIPSNELKIFGQRAHDLRQFQDSHAQLLEEVLSYCARLEHTRQTESFTLKKALQDAQLDLDDARKSRREFQQEAQTYKEQVQQLQSTNTDLRDAYAYVAVLIDGDGCLFQEKYLREGIEGGKMAAHALHAAIMEQSGDMSSKVEIVVKVCANQAGLAMALRQAGIISNEQVFKQFCQGFNQSKASFDFVDVGPGKERADAKIRECARWHLNNANCKMLLLGISHDSGYAPFLDELRSSSNNRDRLCILEGTPTVRELQAANIGSISFNETVFRNDKLILDRTGYNNSNSNSNSNSNGSSNSFFPTVNGRSASSSNPPPMSSMAENEDPVVGRPAARGSPAGSGSGFGPGFMAGPKPGEASSKDGGSLPPTPVSSYATATVSTAARPEGPPSLTFPAATTKTLQNKAAAIAIATAKLMEKNKTNWSPGKRGLDPPVTYNAVAVDAVKRRKGPEKFCNTFVLCGYCTKDYCEYNHKLKATPDEKKALAFLMRQSPCGRGQECTNEDCIYGHNCPSVRDGQCMQPYCRFPSKLHPPKTKFKQPFLGDE